MFFIVKKIFSSLFILAAILWAATGTFDKLHATKYAGEPFSMGFGARALGLGSSYVSVGGDASTVYWNPAGIVNLEGKNLLFMHGTYFDGAESQDFIAGTLPNVLGRGVPLGISLYLLSSSGIKATEIQPGDTVPDEGNIKVTDTLNYRAYKLTLSSAKRMFGGAVGITMKFLGEDLSVESAWGVGVDIGYLYRRGPTGIGIVGKDITTTPLLWSSGKSESISPSLRVGASFNTGSFLFTGDWLILTEGRKTEAPIELGPLSLEPHVGAEIMVTRGIGLRAGFDNGDLTFGVGVKFRIWQIDYAFLSHPELGSSHRFSLAVRL